MRMRSRLATASLLAALALAGGCETKRGLPTPIGVQTVILDPEFSDGALSVGLGMQLDLALPPVTEPGHVWQIVHNDTRYLRPLNELAPPSEDFGRSIAKFHAMRMGRSVLRFLVVPAAPVREARPVDHYDIVVTIN